LAPVPVASSGVGRSLYRSPGALAVKSSGLTLPLMESRRNVVRRRPGCGLALQPRGVVLVTAGVVQGVAQAAKSCPASRARPRGGGCGSSPR
jgi:hypothetical protein